MGANRDPRATGAVHEQDARTQVLLGRDCFVVIARAIPPGVQQRPGVTLLLGRGSALTIELSDRDVRSGWSFLLAPEQRRRFVGAQPHYSITIEPGHDSYASYLRWARDLESSESGRSRLADSPPRVAAAELERLSSAGAFDAWLHSFLTAYAVDPPPAQPLLLDFFGKLRELEASQPDATAEQVWRAFRAKRPGEQTYWSRWLHGQIGISLRKLVQWRKMRRAIEAAVDTRHATSVAHTAGFSDSAHLSRVCLRTLGVRPSDVQNDKTVQVLLLPRD
jgi:hypothetical protein